jgi:hypothetical protein
MKFEVFVTMNLKVQAFWGVMPCSTVNGYLLEIQDFHPPNYTASYSIRPQP